ncbi:hypothetical protein FSO04_43700 [Paraburkholderia madseniana]|uniref:Molecular chaperone Tir n=1 Tax=Paraburkholderia madseniana TaxID=2599607 RepID=A0A6N6W2C3_9BURK|nr:CesT family type III secretion system chaperone [Paraburkholderia madseniana]KAE8753700.1 hypothetical protein FSO04_43700 [Paraburkholderia madseniana]
MASENYVKLIRGFCELVKIDDCDTVLEQGSVAVNGIGFSFVSVGPVANEELLVYCDFGELPEHRQHDICRRLLEINVFLSSGMLPAAFALNPESSHVLLSYRTLLAQTDAETLANSLKLFVEQVESWRSGFFLDSRDNGWSMAGEAGGRVSRVSV